MKIRIFGSDEMKSFVLTSADVISKSKSFIRKSSNINS